MLADLLERNIIRVSLFFVQEILGRRWIVS